MSDQAVSGAGTQSPLIRPIFGTVHEKDDLSKKADLASVKARIRTICHRAGVTIPPKIKISTCTFDESHQAIVLIWDKSEHIRISNKAGVVSIYKYSDGDRVKIGTLTKAQFTAFYNKFKASKGLNFAKAKMPGCSDYFRAGMYYARIGKGTLMRKRLGKTLKEKLKHPTVSRADKMEIIRGLSAIKNRSTLNFLVSIVNDKTMPVSVRALAIHHIGQYPDALKDKHKGVVPALKGYILHKGADVGDRAVAIRVLANIKTEEAKQALTALLESDIPHELKTDIALAIEEMDGGRPKQAVTALFKLASDKKLSGDQRYRAIAALAKLGTKESLGYLLKLLGDPTIKADVLACIADHPLKKQATTKLMDIALNGTSIESRQAALRTLASIEDPSIARIIFRSRLSTDLKIFYAQFAGNSRVVGMASIQFLLKVFKTTRSSQERCAAGRALAGLNNPHVVKMMATKVINNRGYGPLVRLAVAQALLANPHIEKIMNLPPDKVPQEWKATYWAFDKFHKRCLAFLGNRRTSMRVRREIVKTIATAWSQTPVKQLAEKLRDKKLSFAFRAFIARQIMNNPHAHVVRDQLKKFMTGECLAVLRNRRASQRDKQAAIGVYASLGNSDRMVDLLRDGNIDIHTRYAIAKVLARHHARIGPNGKAIIEDRGVRRSLVAFMAGYKDQSGVRVRVHYASRGRRAWRGRVRRSRRNPYVMYRIRLSSHID